MTSTDNTIDGYCPKGQFSDNKDASHLGRLSLASDQQGNRSVSCLRRRPPVSCQMAKLESAFDLAGNMFAPPQKLPLPKSINLLGDRKEERDVAAYNSWVADPAVRIIGALEARFEK